MISWRRATESAWPCSSKAMTIAAAPYRRHSRACARKESSPSLRLIELTTLLPCTQRKPASMTSKLLESIITGTRAMSGSVMARSRNRCMAKTPSVMPSSMLTSMICAPFSTCWRATSRAAVKSPALISRRNRAEPVMLVRSPTFTNSESASISSGSKPDSANVCRARAGLRGLALCAFAAECAGCGQASSRSSRRPG